MSPPPRLLVRDPRLLRVRRYVRTNLHRRITVEEAADIACVSVSYFSRFFRREVGVPWQAWLKVQRVRRAETLLMRGTDVLDVALALGYESERSLQRAFKSVTGLTPRDWRLRSRRARVKAGERANDISSGQDVSR